MEFNLFTISKKGVLFKSYEIIGETQADYKVKSEGIFFKSMMFYDHNGREVLKVNRKTNLLKKEYEVVRDTMCIARIAPIMNITKPHLRIESQLGHFEIIGNFLRNDFTIVNNNIEIAKVSRRLLKSQGYIGVAINDEQDHEFILALVMVIEMKLLEEGYATG